MNMNDRVRIRLHDSGRAILRAHATRFGDDHSSLWPVNDEGFAEMHLWEVMQIFGPHIRMGPPPPFETEFFLAKDRPDGPQG